jgi:sterol desaturase/sphingolipid hydroxylase (fatty acid hydroxylase superfamily)
MRSRADRKLDAGREKGLKRTRLAHMESVLANLPPIVLVLAFAGFWIWEAAGAARSCTNGWSRRARNLFVSVLGIAIGAVASLALIASSALVGQLGWGLSAPSRLPAWMVAILGVALLDLADYWRHRISHSAPILWRLHRVHHSDPQVDVTTSFRSHPLEFLLRPVFLAVAVVGFGVPTLPLLLYPVLQLPVLVFQHANVALPSVLDRALSFVIVTPGMHLVHHSRAQPETDSNYSTFLSIWDRAFGSWKPSVAPTRLGLDGLDDDADQRLIGIFRQPWRDAAVRPRAITDPVK